jgi:hypothetical protein
MIALQLLQKKGRGVIASAFFSSHVVALSDRPFKAPHGKRQEADAQVGHILLYGHPSIVSSTTT